MPSFLSGRTVMVTGATTGIGYETARLLAESGATVLLHGRTLRSGR
ncbi:short subunit dehydrogenase [Streptomyces sp. CG 926]|nr:short subunit dehydrogenase [Streptomyces sp. CG 926]